VDNVERGKWASALERRCT